MSQLLDTSILLAYVRRGLLLAWIEAQYALTTSALTPYISIVTQGEMRALALRLARGAAKVQRLNQLLSLFIVVPLPIAGVIDAYARIDHCCVQNGLAVGKNDLWIAATANVTGAAILTPDRDFDPLHGVFLQRDWVDPASRL